MAPCMNAPSLGARDEGDVECPLVDVVELDGAGQHLRLVDAVCVQSLYYLEREVGSLGQQKQQCWSCK